MKLIFFFYLAFFCSKAFSQASFTVAVGESSFIGGIVNVYGDGFSSIKSLQGSTTPVDFPCQDLSLEHFTMSKCQVHNNDILIYFNSTLDISSYSGPSATLEINKNGLNSNEETYVESDGVSKIQINLISSQSSYSKNIVYIARLSIDTLSEVSALGGVIVESEPFEVVYIPQ